MKPARRRDAATVALVVAVAAWLGLRWWTRSGGNPPALPWTTLIGTAVLIPVVLAAGRPVRRWVTGRRERPLDPLVAARTVVLAKAAALGGAVLTGVYAGAGAVYLPDLVGARRGHFLLDLGCAAAAAGLVVAGFVVQSWCRVDRGSGGATGTGTEPDGTQNPQPSDVDRP